MGCTCKQRKPAAARSRLDIPLFNDYESAERKERIEWDAETHTGNK